MKRIFSKARVLSHTQKDDLERQVELIRSYASKNGLRRNRNP